MCESPPRFVVLHHVLADSAHWDLMLDQGQALATWQLASDPAVLADPASQATVQARRIGDHRRAYLAYEGPVSGDRGHVTRFYEGTYETISQTAHEWVIRLAGNRLAGLFRITDPEAGQPGLFHRLEG